MLLMSALFTTFQLLEIFNEEIFFERNLITFWITPKNEAKRKTTQN